MGTRAIERVGDAVAAALALAWIGGLALLLRHRLVVSHDTMINYAHVWYVSKRLWGGHGIPFRMPVLGHGQAFALIGLQRSVRRDEKSNTEVNRQHRQQ